MCQTAFSALTNMKTKYRSRLVVENDMRVLYVYPTLRQELTVFVKRSKHIHHTSIACLPL